MAQPHEMATILNYSNDSFYLGEMEGGGVILSFRPRRLSVPVPPLMYGPLIMGSEGGTGMMHGVAQRGDAFQLSVIGDQ